MRHRHAILALMLLLNIALLVIAWRVLSYQRTRATRETGQAEVAAVPAEQVQPLPAAPSAIVEVPATPAATALTAFQVAEPLALSWVGDALLLQARGDWPQGSFNPELESWVFLFYSSEREATAQINVVSGSAQMVAEAAATGLVAPSGGDGWQIDSDTIVATFLDGAGGEMFIDERAEVSMVLTLKVGAGAVWTATLVDWETGDVFGRDFDAHSGFVAAEF